MPKIAIGAGAVIAVLAGVGLPVSVVLLVGGVLLILYGGYEEYVKPHFRVEQRLGDWFLRRGWRVKIERQPQFNFIIHLTSSSSEKEVYVTRDRQTHGDLAAFTGKVPYRPEWFEILPGFSEAERESLLTDIRIYLTAKNLALDLSQTPDGRIAWPPVVTVQTALPQDHTLSQHAVDIAAKTIELSLIGIRDVIRKAVTAHLAASGHVRPSPRPAAESGADMASAEPTRGASGSA
jgi:hypothetical protein